MLRNLFNRFFPIPNFLVASSFGLDISDESLKFAELVVGKDGLKLGRYGERSITPGIIESGKIKDPKRLKDLLVSLKQELSLKAVRVSLPEEQVYLFRLRIEKLGLKNIRESIELALEEHIPIPARDAIFDYEILSEDDKYLELQVAAIPTMVIKSYLEVFEESGISVQSCELEAQAIARSVIPKGDKDTYMIVDFGRTRTGIFIISNGLVAFTSTFDIGGEDLIEMVEKSLNVSTEEAKKIKVEFGLKRNVANKEIFPAILNIVSVLRDEMAKHLLYWQTHKDDDGKARPPIKKVILCGGDSNLSGFAEYISVSMKIPVELSNVWQNINAYNKSTPEIPFNQSLAFASVFGLALGDFEHD